MQFDAVAASFVHDCEFEVGETLYLFIVDADDDGTLQTWTLEMDDVEDMAEQGVTSETLLVGDEIVVFGFPARDGSRQLHIERFHRPSDGLEYEDD